jgi:hypothetical protein
MSPLGESVTVPFCQSLLEEKVGVFEEHIRRVLETGLKIILRSELRGRDARQTSKKNKEATDDALAQGRKVRLRVRQRHRSQFLLAS